MTVPPLYWAMLFVALISQHCRAEERAHIPQLESKPLPNAALDAVRCQFHKGPGLCRVQEPLTAQVGAPQRWQ